MSLNNFDEQGRFLLPDFDRLRPFSSFLPGIAGPLGVPLWAFYANRGQAITSFGVESKDSPILEFQPANKAYQLAALTGFRTFVRLSSDSDSMFYEPFAPRSRSAQVTRLMAIGMNELALSEENEQIGLKTGVLYLTLTGEPFAGLLRQVTLTNTGAAPLTLELLDGLPALIPYGVDNGALKRISRTIEAWMEVFNVEQRLPFYRLRASSGDTAHVEAIVAGHFALAFDEAGELLAPLVDPEAVFDQNTALSAPDRFLELPLANLLTQRQIRAGKTPCAFFGEAATLAPGQSTTLTAIFGHAASLETLQSLHGRFLTPGYVAGQRQKARDLARSLTDAIDTRSSQPMFDAYARQTFLDNVLRGGWPVLLGDEPHRHVYHIYSRKHGDPERDYNDFFLAAEYYSQGNGNYRDVNQNRRNDVFFQPAVGDFNIRLFMSLIQADGYNPLVVRGTTFTLAEEYRPGVLAQVEQPESLADVLARPFTPGSLLKHIENHGVRLRLPAEDFLALALRNAGQQIEAEFGEGFWIDHWTYNLDLIESYLALFPERKAALLFETRLPYYDSPASVRPRDQRYVLVHGQPRQLNALWEDEEKAALIASRPDEPTWTRSDHGQGEIVYSTLFEKLVLLALLKFTTLDPLGMGVEMEAGKPGWYDALNGLPGLFGSAMPETFELQRLLRFLLEVIDEQTQDSLELPVEAADLLDAAADRLDRFNLGNGNGRDFALWNDLSTAREAYRARTRLGFDGAMVSISLAELAQTFRLFLAKVEAGIKWAMDLNHGLPPTYFRYEVEGYNLLAGPDGQPLLDDEGRQRIWPARFRQIVLPPFLEGPARAMKVTPDLAAARDLHRLVRSSDLYDRKLGMFKVNASLAGQPHAIGRARAFTPGWLENESIWLHMAYKYLLALLEAGLFEEFYTEARSSLIPFLDPAMYGRSPLENSSFIVSSAHPDETLHGAGFVARLSGSTAELLSIWRLMMAGPQPFRLRNGELLLTLRPALAGWLFAEDGALRFRFLGHTTVTYHNPNRLDTWQANLRQITLTLAGGERVQMAGDVIGQPWAEAARAGQVETIDVYLDI